MGHDHDTIVKILGAFTVIFLLGMIVEVLFIMEFLHARKSSWYILAAMQQLNGQVTLYDWKRTITAGNTRILEDIEVANILGTRKYDIAQPPRVGEENYEMKLQYHKKNKRSTERMNRINGGIETIQTEMKRRKEAAEDAEDRPGGPGF